jgi:hypothetical protein
MGVGDGVGVGVGVGDGVGVGVGVGVGDGMGVGVGVGDGVGVGVGMVDGVGARHEVGWELVNGGMGEEARPGVPGREPSAMRHSWCRIRRAIFPVLHARHARGHAAPATLHRP